MDTIQLLKEAARKVRPNKARNKVVNKNKIKKIKKIQKIKSAAKPKVKPMAKPTLHSKIDSLTKKVSSYATKAKKAVPSAKFTPKKIGMVAAGVAGTTALIAKVRQKRMEGEA